MYRILRESPLFTGIGIRQGAPEPGKTGSDISVYPYSQGPNGGPIGLNPITANPSVGVTRSFLTNATESDVKEAVRQIRDANRLLHGSAGLNPYGLVVSCFYAREIDTIENDASGQRWVRLGSIYEVTVRSEE